MYGSLSFRLDIDLPVNVWLRVLLEEHWVVSCFPETWIVFAPVGFRVKGIPPVLSVSVLVLVRCWGFFGENTVAAVTLILPWYSGSYATWGPSHVDHLIFVWSSE